MGVAIAGLVAGFILLNDIQQEKESQDHLDTKNSNSMQRCLV